MTPSGSADTTPRLPSSQLVLVTGKGGVGRSTVASAVALELARRGGRVALVHPVDAPPVHPSPIEPATFEVLPLDRDDSLDQYIRDVLPGPLAAALRASKAFRLITAATPGLAELLVIGELRRLSLAGYDHIVYDAPATGHLLALLDAPARFERAAAVGPIARRANELGTWIHDQHVTSFVAVTTGDALALSELADLLDELEERLGRLPELVVANRLAPPSPPAAELEALGDVQGLDEAATAAIVRLATRSRSERSHLGKVTRRMGVAPLQSLERPDHPVAAVLDALAPLGGAA